MKEINNKEIQITIRLLYLESVKGILFDMDGVLIDSMPYHAEALYQALKSEIDYSLDKKFVFLLEGMPADKFLYKIFKIKPPKAIVSKEQIDKIVNLKKKIFKEIENITPIDGAKDLVEELNKLNCFKAIVSGASKNEVYYILEKHIGIKYFDAIITGDDVTKGKPDPQPYVTALKKINTNKNDALVIENSPLGVRSAINADIKFIITLNKTPLTILDFYDYIPSKIKNDINRYVFKDTESIKEFVLNWIDK